MNKSMKQKSNNSIKSLIKLAGPHKVKMIFSVILAVLGEGFGLVPFILMYFLITHIHGKPAADIDLVFIMKLGFSGMGAVFLKGVFLAVSGSLSHIAAYEELYNLRSRIAKKLVTLPLGFFNKRTTGQVKKVFLEDVEQMEIFIAHNIPEFMGAVIILTLTAVVLFVFDWRLALATISIVPLGFLAQSLTMRKMGELIKNYYNALEDMNSVVIQYIQGMPVIKAFNHTVESFHKYSSAVRKCKKYEDVMTEKWSLPMTVFSIAIAANLLVLMPVGALMYMAGSISISKFVFFLCIGLGFGAPLYKLLSLGSLMTRNKEGVQRINALFFAPSLVEPVKERMPEDSSVSALNIEFSYDHTEILKKISFELKPENFLALVGPSGAGKTTVARLIPRFWDVGKGAIYIGNTDIREMKINTLMDQVTFVFQELFLFNDTIYENLKMGKSDATEKEIHNAAKMARCHEFIMSTPKGYQSVIGEKGTKLSGGEKQRLSIARAILKDSPIVVLDEATAFIDPENENLIQEGLNTLTEKKTLIVIAHRLSTIINADQILVIDKGEPICAGKHSHLLNNCGLYKDLWEAHTVARDWAI
jgi:ATP-binding cassette subfamily B protein